MKNRWTNVIPPVADHPTEKYSTKFLIRLKPIAKDDPQFRPADPNYNTGNFRTVLAYELGKLMNQGIPWEFQPLEGSGAFDDGETVDPTALQEKYDTLKAEQNKLQSILSSAKRQAEATLATLNGEY